MPAFGKDVGCVRSIFHTISLRDIVTSESLDEVAWRSPDFRIPFSLNQACLLAFLHVRQRNIVWSRLGAVDPSTPSLIPPGSPADYPSSPPAPRHGWKVPLLLP